MLWFFDILLTVVFLALRTRVRMNNISSAVSSQSHTPHSMNKNTYVPAPSMPPTPLPLPLPPW